MCTLSTQYVYGYTLEFFTILGVLRDCVLVTDKRYLFGLPGNNIEVQHMLAVCALYRGQW